ncbi:SKAP1 protein, partial [Columbina picui]|nr:SKAP1 protein [Columbina picui]
SFFGSEWQKRWCVLNRRTFSYYANEKSEWCGTCCGGADTPGPVNSHLTREKRSPGPAAQRNNGCPSLQFTAPSPAEAEDWVDQIQFLLKDLSSLTIPCDEDEDEEGTYNDVDSLDSAHTASHNSTLAQDEPSAALEDDDIYEVLPGK